MALIITPSEGSHYYLPDGTTFYQVECKTKPGEYREPNRNDAKEVGAFPSVTTVLATLRKPVLEAWKVEEGIRTAARRPYDGKEPLDDYVRTIGKLSKDESVLAADVGTTVHGAIEHYHKTGEIPELMNIDAQAPFDAYVEWASKRIVKVEYSEACFFCRDGWGGRVDMVVTFNGDDGRIRPGRWLVDIKTQKTKPREKFKVHEDWHPQLAACHYGLGSFLDFRGIEPGIGGDVGCGNLAISTTEPGRIEFLPITDYEWSLEMFRAALVIWQYQPAKRKEDAGALKKKSA